ncbi:sigma-54 dependent transcriptional regulator [Ruminococcaceae bacterium OttesenSCG-928-D13]|nr:sigma-54 dependent transcriptional regulator [Ruminococcaceae bacterium OttesenSCG-928-D13]
MTTRPQIMVLDDEKGICLFLSMSLEDNYTVHTANTPEQAYKLLEKHDISLALVDLMLGRESGLDVLRTLREKHPEVVVIMMTAFGNISSSVEAIKLGAHNYLQKPVNIEELRMFIAQALEFQSLGRRVEYLSGELETRNSYGNMVGRSQPMQKVYKLADRLKAVDTNVMITGESGTGKELIARAIHFSGLRKAKPFVTTNCAAIPSGLLEEEFFGHKKGAFTGAYADSAGKLEQADGGTLFLDEIGELPMELQGKLLRAIQEKETCPIGGDEVKKIDVRFIAATNCDLWAMVQSGTFRQDLYYRLQVIEVKMPPLRERRQDIPLLCELFIKKLGKETGRSVAGLTRHAETLLMNYDYPGNVRELMNALEYAMVLCDGELIDVEDLPENIRTGLPREDAREMDLEQVARVYLAGQSIKSVERAMIEIALEQDQSKRKVAQMLGISERTLFYKIQEYEL